ncbi:sugar phosphate isomerase/epimerase family protein [Paenibacillus radicis (ex Xue et al. 2023)]|uniref:Sugar phosphate isomerase/epimerase n=1 Tax=Paenibacillus radicis (ex Xue et al. 2023) TaxID=2972489 RepID=A0ABT1YG25_9BACL|nr:sugar phosphate isomerase/epimerase family protein [Paenibacillus radicis (ex Xue et al. 2023)]MCR8632146.1 sugar phosphate isomerase/epimerase [Paenibacillus radicis (ex Xue et al. 2023)]
MKWKIGMRIPRMIGEQGFDNTAKWAAGVGLDVLDIGGTELAAKKEICDRYGLEIGSVDASLVGHLLSADESKRENALESIKRQMDDMASIGASVMFMCLVPEDRKMPRHETFAIWKETFPEVIRYAEQKGVYIAIEGWPGPSPELPTIGCTPEMWRAMFEAIPSKHFGLNYDPSHLVWLRIDYLRALSEFGERVNHCHGKDTEILYEELYNSGVISPTLGSKYHYSGGSWRYTIPGHGTVEWDKVAVRLDRLGYKGAICIELEDHRFHGTIENEQQGIVKAYEHLTKYFK